MWTKLTRIWLTKTFKPYKFIYKQVKPEFKEIENLGLYLHIPFCEKICPFCPYCKQVFDREKMELYVKSLLKEIDLKCKNLTEKKSVTTLYIGGGSPILAMDYFKDIFEKINKYFNIKNGIGVELHPRDITLDNLQKLKELGVTKISVGIQSFDKDVLKALHREPLDENYIKNILQKVKFDVVSFDFIFGVYNQTEEKMKNDLDMAFSIGANCVATYPFIDFKHLNNDKKGLQGKKEKDMIKFIHKYCESKNYHRNSIWTFSKGERINYSSMTRDSFLGFGCSATSLIKDQFIINTFSVEEYAKKLDENVLPTSLVADFIKRQNIVYYLFWQTYSTKVSLKEFEKKYGKPLKELYPTEIFMAKRFKIITEDNENIYLTVKGMYWFYKFEQHFTLSYIDKMWNIMGKTAFPDEVIIK